MSTKDEILRLFETLSEEERSDLLLELRDKEEEQEPKIVKFKFIQGNRVDKTSSKECSAPQRLVFLGSGGSKLQSLPNPIIDEPVAIDQGCVTKDGAYVFTSSNHIAIKAQPSDPESDVAKVADSLKSFGVLDEIRQKIPKNYTGQLCKSLGMRTSDKFNRLPVSYMGELLMGSPHYPNNTLTELFLPAVPWQRYIYTLKPSWYTTTGLLFIGDNPYLAIKDNFCIALLPLEHGDENQEN